MVGVWRSVCSVVEDSTVLGVLASVNELPQAGQTVYGRSAPTFLDDTHECTQEDVDIAARPHAAMAHLFNARSVLWGRMRGSGRLSRGIPTYWWGRERWGNSRSAIEAAAADKGGSTLNVVLLSIHFDRMLHQTWKKIAATSIG